MIKAIETKYKGYRFRSRLEARWAVFFDALGIAWEYEPEGYDLGDGVWYLPDFYFPNGLLDEEVKFAEVKFFQGQDPFSVPVRFPELDLFAKKISSIAFLDGTPDFTFYYVGRYCRHFKEVEWCEDAMLYADAMGENRWFACSGKWRGDLDEYDHCLFEQRYVDAINAARSARFEFGETPTMPQNEPPVRIELSPRAMQFIHGEKQKPFKIDLLGPAHYAMEKEFIAFLASKSPALGALLSKGSARYSKGSLKVHVDPFLENTNLLRRKKTISCIQKHAVEFFGECSEVSIIDNI